MKYLLSLFLVLLPFHGAFAEDSCVYRPIKETQTEELRRGVNLAAWWWGKRQYDFTSDDFRTIKKHGFNFVRIPISEQVLSLADKKKQDKIISELRCDIIGLLNSGLMVVVSMHPTREHKKSTKGMDRREVLESLLNYWKVLIPVLDGLPEEKILLDLYNEPSRHITDWWEIQSEVITGLRTIYPRHTYIASDTMGRFENLKKRKPYTDSRVIYDFHFYKPIYFTHHNVPWIIPKPDIREKTDQIIYPSSMEKNDDPTYLKMVEYKKEGWDKEKLSGMLKETISWSRQNNVKIVCLEFGVYRPYVDSQSRIRWLKDVREILEENHIPWALWSYRGKFGLQDENGVFEKDMAVALGLNDSEHD